MDIGNSVIITDFEMCMNPLDMCIFKLSSKGEAENFSKELAELLKKYNQTCKIKRLDISMKMIDVN